MPPFVRVGRHVRYGLRDLDGSIEERTFSTTTKAGNPAWE